MRYFFIAIFTMLLMSPSVQSEDQILNKVKEQLETYQKKCENKTFPKDEMEKDIALFDVSEKEMHKNLVQYWGNAKKAEQDYAVCIKEIIIEKIKHEFPQESKIEILEAIEEIQSGTLKLYWYLYNSQDNGLIGQLQNDAAMSRVYDKILEDIILYLTVYGPPLDEKKIR